MHGHHNRTSIILKTISIPKISITVAALLMSGCDKSSTTSSSDDRVKVLEAEIERLKAAPPPLPTGALTNANAEIAIKKAFGGSFKVTVSRIQEIPMAGEARGEVSLTDFQWKDDNGRQKPTYTGAAYAHFRHYNTGWVLKGLDLKDGYSEVTSDNFRMHYNPPSFSADQPL